MVKKGRKDSNSQAKRRKGGRKEERKEGRKEGEKNRMNSTQQKG